MAHACFVAERLRNLAPWLGFLLSITFSATGDFSRSRAGINAVLEAPDAVLRHMVEPAAILSFYAQWRESRYGALDESGDRVPRGLL